MKIAGYILTGLAVGTVSGMMGIGGGVLMIPILMWIFKFTQREAIGTTVGVLALPVGLAAAIRHHLESNLDLEAVLCIAPCFAVGAYFGAVIMDDIPRDVLRILFGLLLVYIGILIITSDHHVLSAILGLVVVGLSWLAFLGLRALGRRYQPRQLSVEIGSRQTADDTEPDYYI